MSIVTHGLVLVSERLKHKVIWSAYFSVYAYANHRAAMANKNTYSEQLTTKYGRR